MSASRTSSLGQLLILGVHDHRWSRSLERILRLIEPGGVLLYPGALRSPGQTAELLHQIARTLSSPPLLAIAEEGGSVNSLQALLPPLPTPRLLARRGTAAVKRSGELIGSALKLLGFNLNLAPRLDLSNPEVKPALDTQTFGADPKLVAECGRAFIEGLRKHRILACGKHFPGRGTPEYDRNGSAIVAKTMASLWRKDLGPFRQLLPQLAFIKLSNACYKAYDFDVEQPAVMSSRVVHDLLRVKLGYCRPVVADLFEHLEELSEHAEPKRAYGLDFIAFALSTKAGCDLQILKPGEWLSFAESVSRVMSKELDTGSLSQRRVAEALGRIRAAKKGLKRPNGKVSARSFDRLAREFEEFSQQARSGGDVEA